MVRMMARAEDRAIDRLRENAIDPTDDSAVTAYTLPSVTLSPKDGEELMVEPPTPVPQLYGQTNNPRSKGSPSSR